MQFSHDEIEQFQKLWRAEYGAQIDDAQALKEAQRLITLIKFAIETAHIKVDAPPADKNKH